MRAQVGKGAAVTLCDSHLMTFSSVLSPFGIRLGKSKSFTSGFAVLQHNHFWESKCFHEGQFSRVDYSEKRHTVDILGPLRVSVHKYSHTDAHEDVLSALFCTSNQQEQ